MTDVGDNDEMQPDDFNLAEDTVGLRTHLARYNCERAALDKAPMAACVS